jgi:hypothetical protein
MKCFHNFTTAIWEIFSGNLLLFFCCMFYLLWWIVSFKPNSSGGSSSTVYITAAFITGVIAIALMSSGIYSLSKDSRSLPVKLILLGGAALYIILQLITVSVFHRIVTSELIIIHMWAALELSVVAVLYGTGQFKSEHAVILVALVGIAFVASLICYVLYDRLNDMASYLDGMIPLIMAAFVIVFFLGVLSVS